MVAFEQDSPHWRLSIKQKSVRAVPVALPAIQGSRIARLSRKSNAEVSRCMIFSQLIAQSTTLEFIYIIP